MTRNSTNASFGLPAQGESFIDQSIQIAELSFKTVNKKQSLVRGIVIVPSPQKNTRPRGKRKFAIFKVRKHKVSLKVGVK